MDITGTFEIARLELRAGDRLVIKVEAHLSRDQEEYIRAHFKQYLPEGVEMLVLDKHMSLSVLAREGN
jgi:hypothetical protein